MAQLEIGYFDYGAITDQGVIWIRLLMRDSANSGPSDTDVTVTVGKEETTMFKKTIKFWTYDAFVGFHGKQSSSTKLPITQLGAVTFKCLETAVSNTAEESKDETWKDAFEDFYDEYDILIFIGCAILGLFLICCVSCCCYIRCKKKEIKMLQM